MKRQGVAILLCLLLIFSSFAGGCKKGGTKSNHAESQSDTSVKGKMTSSQIGYEDKLFDTSSIHEISIEMPEKDLKDLLENPTEKTKYEANITIDGEKISSVSIATKGNTSLSQVAMDEDSDRYSFKINFGKYKDNQTYHGLDKLNLNNIMSDATYMKDYLSYQIMGAAGVAAPLTSYASISINGKAWGLYLAIEDIGESFLVRNYGEKYGELYKPETAMLNNMGKMAGGKGGMGPGGKVPDGMQMPGNDKTAGADKTTDTADTTDKTTKSKETGGNTKENTGTATNQNKPTGTAADSMAGRNAEGMIPGGKDGWQMTDNLTEEQKAEFKEQMEKGYMGMPFNMGKGMDDNSKGADLAYSDDKTESYSDIFDNAETDAEEADQKRLMAALKQLSEGETLEGCVNVEEVLQYFVAHNFVVNFDSYTGNMLHNYYLYETNGILSILPWDYNLAFGGFSSQSSATDLVNWAIDTPLSGTSEEKRPIWGKLIQQEENKEQYHKYFDELITSYFESGKCEAEIDRVHDMIAPYVAKDTSAFYTEKEFEKAVSTLKTFCKLRAESIRKQLNGEIPSDTDGQKADGVKLIDATSITISDMGSQGGRAGGPGDMKMPQGGAGGLGDRQKPQGQEGSDLPQTEQSSSNTESGKKQSNNAEK